MTYNQFQMPILDGINDIPSSTGDATHPNASLFCDQFNSLITALTGVEGIKSIALTNSVGLIDTYTMYADVAQTQPVGTFQVTNGADGPQGPAGPTTIAVGTTTTTAPGTNADVTNSGTASDLILDFDIPRGDVGAQGPAGANGSDGADGQGVPIGGTTGQILSKIDNTDYNTQWINAPSGGGADLNTANTWTKSQTVAQITLTDAATIVVDASLSNNFVVTLGGNRTLGNPTNLIAGKTLNFVIKQDGTGGHTLAYGNLYKFPFGIDPVIPTTANHFTILSCYYDGGVLICNSPGDYS